MCTLSWLASAHGYDLYFNRDEKRTRPRALPPALHVQKDVECLYATDPGGGGSWMGVNNRGVTLAILNHYAAEAAATVKPKRSRGRLLVDQLAVPTALGAMEAVSVEKVEEYAPFIFTALDGLGPMRSLTWDGVQLEYTQLQAAELITTSSFDTDAVVAGRKQQFKHLLEKQATLRASDLLSFHQSREPGPGPYAVSMERDDAKSWSLSHIQVSKDGVTYAYADGAPHETALGEPIQMDRHPGVER